MDFELRGGDHTGRQAGRGHRLLELWDEIRLLLDEEARTFLFKS